MTQTLFSAKAPTGSQGAAAAKQPQKISGRHYIQGQWQAEKLNSFSAVNAVTFEPLPWLFAECQATELDKRRIRRF